MAHLLMASPRYYAIEYEINPWMSRLHGAEPTLAQAQWSHLCETLADACAAELVFVDPQPGLPDLVFTANAGLVADRRVILSRFRFPVRSGEEPVFGAWFREHGFEVDELPEDVFFEGAGDALFSGEKLFCGYHFRSEIRSHTLVAERLGRRVLSLQLTDPRFYHLDTCFCPLSRGEVIYYPSAFDEYGRKVIEANVADAIVVNDEDAHRFGCNAICVGDHVVVPAGCSRLVSDLTGRGYTVHSVNLSEYLKSGGAAKCLTLRLD